MINAVDAATSLNHLSDKMIVYCRQVGLAHKPLANTLLVGDDEDVVEKLGEESHSLEDAVDDTEIVGAGDIAVNNTLVENAITVKK